VRVACAAEGEAYVAHAAAMLHSVLTHGDAVEAHFLHSTRFDPAWGDAIAAMFDREGGSIRFHPIDDERVAGLPVTEYFTSAMWFRIFLPELLPEAGKVLYLDADTLAVDSLAPLWETDLTGHWLGAVTNVFQENHRERPFELGLPSRDVYFNSGVLLLNLEEMRSGGCTKALCELATDRADELAWPDQDALNLVLGERRLPLHPRWNAMNSILEWESAVDVFGDDAVREARERPGIRHFEGPTLNKPWFRGCERDLRELYFRHRAATPWPDVRLERPPRRSLRQVLTAIRPV
jgi:lipopolysaccharide biosynthesis glycosyltransferase